MGPDFLGNSCSNTLRSNCSQLKWPLMRHNNKTTNHCYYFKVIGTWKITHMARNWTFYQSHYIFLFFPQPPTPLFSLSNRKTAETAHHLGNPAQSPEQRSNIFFKVSPLLSLSLNRSPTCPPTQSLSPVSCLSWGICSLLAHATNLHIIEIFPGGLWLQSWCCFAEVTLATVRVTCM